jgi:hypothetical protein
VSTIDKRERAIARVLIALGLPTFLIGVAFAIAARRSVGRHGPRPADPPTARPFRRQALGRSARRRSN